MRYFLELAYKGKMFCGFQRQLGQESVQEKLETALAKLLRHNCPIVGCGRTDTGVHARQYYAHFDSPNLNNRQDFVYKLNALVGYEISILDLHQVHDEAHARFDAVSRSYEYYLSALKNPFRQDYQYTLLNAGRMDWDKIQAAANLLLEYEEFAPFCKTHTDTKTRRCALSHSAWKKVKRGRELGL